MHDPQHMNDIDHAERLITLMGGALVFGSCAGLTLVIFMLYAVAFDIPWGLR